MRVIPIAILITNLCLMAVIGVYDLASYGGLAPMNEFVLVGFLALVSLSNLFYVGIAWRSWQKLSLLGRVMTAIWGWYTFWCWIFCPFYFLLVMNLNVPQLQQALFSFVWEVLMLGGVFIWLCYILFKPLHQYALHTPTDLSKELAVTLHHRAMRFPLYVALLIFVLSIVGFGSATAQERIISAMPYIEAIKNYLIGFVAAIFLSLIYYVILKRILEPLSSDLQERSGVETRARSSIARSVLTASLIVVIGSLLLLQLLVIKSFQNIVRDGIYATLEQDVQAQVWGETAKQHGVILLNPQESQYAEEHVTFDTQSYVASHENGIIDDFEGNVKLLAFFTDLSSGEKSVIIIPLEAYYGPMVATISSFVFGAFFVLLVGIGIAWLVTRSLTKSLHALTEALRKLDSDPTAQVPRIASGDEVEDLSEALGYFVHRSQRIDQEKNEFISIASHHLRTPLTELRWLIESVKRGDPSKNIGTYLPNITVALAHLSDLVKLLLDTSRFSSTGVTLSPGPVNLGTYFGGLEQKFSELAKEGSVTLTCHAPADVTIQTDLVFFSVVIESLVTNAIQYTLPGGSVQVLAEPTKDGVRITCSDTGIGIPKEAQEQMFLKFSRAENAKRIRPNGTGLGLYLAKQSVERIGGAISFETTLDTGTTFTVDLPSVLPEGNKE